MSLTAFLRNAIASIAALCFFLQAEAQFPARYCTASFPLGVTPITRVIFDSINNASPVDLHGGMHQDFTHITTHVFTDSTYRITVSGATGSYPQDNYIAYFDWDGDGIFEDGATEELKHIGSITGSTGTDGKTASTLITIPSLAKPGPVRMRVVKSTGIAFACNTQNAGQAEDYTLMVQQTPPRVLRVSASAMGLANGSSWANAFPTLFAALSASRPRDTIKIAAGTYYPGTYDYRPYSFYIREGMVVMGGYGLPADTTDERRNFSRNRTILSGDWGTRGDAYDNDNLTNVVSLNAVSEKTIIDGLIIENGNADSYHATGFNKGAGMGMSFSSPVIRNCVFRNNQAPGEGGAIAISGGSPRIINCFFISNQAGSSTIWIEKESNPVIANCVFSKNTGTPLKLKRSAVTVMHSTFVNNRLLSHSTVHGDTAEIYIVNSIFWQNQKSLSSDVPDFSNVAGSTTVIKTITDVSPTSQAHLVGVQPKFRDTASIAGPDSLYFTADDGLQLLNPCSPAMNAGSTTITESPGKDILGNARVFGASADLGAYEVQQDALSVPAVVYVNKFARGANDGSSWVNAFTDIQQAFQSCSETIKVAAGTYYPSYDNTAASLWMENKRVVLGGYPASGNPGDASRDPKLHPTIISGNLPASGGKKSVVLIRARNVDSTAKLDGFVLEEAALSYTPTSHLPLGSIDYAGAVYVSGKTSPFFRNCIFRKNPGFIGGAAVAKDSAAPSFIDCIFENNNYAGDGRGGAVFNMGSAPRFIKCIFRNNIIYNGTSDFLGAAVINRNASPYFDSCSFLKNEGRDRAGAGMVNLQNSNPVIRNSTFQGNMGNEYGSDLFNDASNPKLFNCSFLGVTGNSGAVANRNGSNPVFDSCRFLDNAVRFEASAVLNDASAPVFRKCVFARSKGQGSCINNRNYSAPKFIGCLFTQNTGSGGSVMANWKSNVTVLQCSFTNNSLSSDAGGYSGVILNQDSNRLAVHNTLFSNNHLYEKNSLEVMDVSTSSLTTMTYSITWSYGTHGVSGNRVGRNARLTDNLDPDGPDNVFFTADDGAIPSRCSPAINAGSNALLIAEPFDAAGSPRIFGSTVDMGAYELQQSPAQPQTLYVNSTATGNGSGGSWNNAYTQLQQAFCNPCSDTVKIAAGTYKPARSSSDSSFYINLPLKVYGGYPASGNPDDNERDPEAHPVVLSGDVGTPANILDNTKTILILYPIKDTIELDGLVIRDAYGGAGGFGINVSGGGGMYTVWNRTVIRNCRFLNNQASFWGGAISMGALTDCLITHSEFEGNSTSLYGGAINFNGAYLKLTHSVFHNNFSPGRGGALRVESGKFELDNSVFYRNYLTAVSNLNRAGGAVYATGGSGTIFNCSFVQNRVPAGLGNPGAGLFINQSVAVRVYNCIFSGNTVGDSAHLTGADTDWDGFNGSVNNTVLQKTRFHMGTNRLGDPAFTNPNLPKGPDGKWRTDDDGLQLQYASAAVNFGDNARVAATPHDILDDPRIVLGTVDAGAYEYQNLPVAMAGSDTTICTGTTVRLGRPGNPAHQYQWTATNGFTSTEAMPVANPAVATSFFLSVSNGTFTSYDTVTVQVANSVVPAVAIQTASMFVCEGSQEKFTAHPRYGGDAPSYQWKLDGVVVGSDSSSFTTHALKNGSKVELMMTSSAVCAVSPVASASPVVMTVHSMVVPSVTIQQDPSPVCSYDVVRFTAQPVNAGSDPKYQWYLNGEEFGTNEPVLAFQTNGFHANDLVQLIMTPSVCAPTKAVNSNTISLQMIQFNNPTVTISSSATTVCSGTRVTFNATGTNWGDKPRWEWKKNGLRVGGDSSSFSTTDLKNGDEITASVTSSLYCMQPATLPSNVIKMTVHPAGAPYVYVSASAQEICQGSPATFKAIMENSAPGAVYRWKVNGANADSGTLLLKTTSLKPGDSVWLAVTQNLACGTTTYNSNKVSMAIKPAVAPSVTLSGNTSGTPGVPVSITANPSISVSDLLYQWQDSTREHGWQTIVGASSKTIQYTPRDSGDRVRSLISGFVLCSGTTAAIMSNVLTFTFRLTGINPVSATEYGIRFYPNPAESILVIDSMKLSDQWEVVEVYGMDGSRQLIHYFARQQMVVLPITQLREGAYLAVLRRKNGLPVYFRFIKL